MDPTAALIAGLAAGLAIAMQVGAVSLLLVETAVSGGKRVGIAAGMGVATVDLLFAAAAAVAGGTAGAVLARHEGELKTVAAIVLAAIAVHGLLTMKSERDDAREDTRSDGPLAHYIRFFAITSANPLTIASFAAVAASMSMKSAGPAIAFAAGVGAASAGWHLLLTAAAGHAGRWITSGIQRGLAIGGRVAVLLIAAHLATSA
jgi:threonine/homoserine/homoserine lactone efflux protein